RQFRAQLPEVFDDAVVNHRHLVGGMRMSIVFARATMGGPAGMTDAGGSMQRRVPQQTFKILNLAHCAATLDAALRQRRHASRIIASILKTLESLDDFIDHVGRADDPNDSAHRNT